MKIKESELRALVRKTFTKLVKEDIGGVEGLKQKDIAKTAANLLATKYGDSLGFMEQDEIKRKVLEAVIDQMKNSTIGVLPVDVALSYGVGGPNLRGSGMKWDLRKEEPYGIYERFDFDVPVGTGEFGTLGAAWDRYIVRVREMLESIKILRQAIDQLPGGDPNEAMPRRVRPPEAEAYMRTESPRGEIGFYLISDGSEKPYRCKGRSPCFTAISAMNAISQGALLADAVVIVGSLDIVLGEIDR